MKEDIVRYEKIVDYIIARIHTFTVKLFVNVSAWEV
jgi:hypothetical protein